MKRVVILVISLSVAAWLGSASADPWKDESGKGRWRPDYRGGYGYYEPREYKQEFHRGGCKIERKWERSGEYKEEVKCKGRN